ncbi:hypothetical protein [Streptomyces sp. enrichment culture]|uniref:hypothetical protein n=1 Tax=Streptomyces sp. enrichment culture TaxID=1795815 RepID=UPI003F55D5DA
MALHDVRARGYEVVVGECTDGSGHLSAPAAERAGELMSMLTDPMVHSAGRSELTGGGPGVSGARGGYGGAPFRSVDGRHVWSTVTCPAMLAWRPMGPCPHRWPCAVTASCANAWMPGGRSVPASAGRPCCWTSPVRRCS